LAFFCFVAAGCAVLVDCDGRGEDRPGAAMVRGVSMRGWGRFAPDLPDSEAPRNIRSSSEGSANPSVGNMMSLADTGRTK
jgi:hypothetical protein